MSIKSYEKKTYPPYKSNYAAGKITYSRQEIIEVKNAKRDLIILTAQEAKHLDELIIQAGTRGFDLMQRAASASLDAILLRWPHAQKFNIFCGSGNNGGDGIVLGELLTQAGKNVCLILVGGKNFSNEAQEAYELALKNGLEFIDFAKWQQSNSSAQKQNNKTYTGEEVLIDALFGIGLNKKPSGAYAQAIDAINSSPWQVCALDLPSGIDASSEKNYSPCIRADLTITFLALKRGLLTKNALDKVGRLYLAKLGVDGENFLFNKDLNESLNQDLHKQIIKKTYLPSEKSIKLAPRSDLAHKGTSGRLLLIGGDVHTAGAIGLSAQAAMRSGAGIVEVLTPKENATWLLARSPELILANPKNDAEIIDLLKKCDSLAIGPGLGTGAWGKKLWRLVIENYEGTCVMDADALNLWAEAKKLGEPLPSETLRKNTCITPHPKEAARLLQTSTEAVEAERHKSCEKLLALSDYGILKGANSLIFSQQKIYFSSFGNGGMATAGMGDILTGILGGLLAQGFSLEKASLTACIAHAQSGDAAAKKIGKRGLIASDLLNFIPSFLN